MRLISHLQPVHDVYKELPLPRRQALLKHAAAVPPRSLEGFLSNLPSTAEANFVREALGMVPLAPEPRKPASKKSSGASKTKAAETAGAP